MRASKQAGCEAGVLAAAAVGAGGGGARSD